MDNTKNLNQKLDSGLTGIAGEYFVAGELSKRGYLASITLRNTRGIDILVTNSDASKSVGIQVKATKANGRSWILNNKADDFYSDTLFYAFVNLNELDNRPSYYIVPSKIVAEHTKTSHAQWLTVPSKKSLSHKDSAFRKFSDPNGEYLEKWKLLGLD